MRPYPLLVLLIAVWAGGASGARAQGSSPRFVALFTRSGSILIREAANQRPWATLAPGLFETGWRRREAIPGDAAGRARIRASAPVAVAVAASAEGETLTVDYTLTPEGALKVCSAHVSLSMPAATWLRARATLGDNEAIVPETVGPNMLLTSAPGVLTLSRQGTVLKLGADSQPALLQDNRTFGSDSLELRLGRQSPEGRDWAAGSPEVFHVRLTLPGPVRLQREEPVTIQAGDDWIPLESKTDIVAGSALDFAPLLGDAPAGRWGRVIVRPDGHFGFERRPTPARFWGVNLCFTANYLEKPEADRLAERLARLGYNAVRLHHYDGALEEPGNLDKLDYLVAACKKRGLYIKTDLYVSRTVPGYDPDAFKAALLVKPEAMEEWKRFARRLLTHVNPYTGLAWKDDPAVAFLSVVNEPNLTNYLGRLDGPLASAYEEAWSKWRAERSLPARSLPRSLESDTGGRELGAFLAETHARAFGTMSQFLRRELGCKALLTDLNGWSEAPALMAARTALDFVDNHFYWDHPDFLDQPWQLPSRGANGGASAVAVAGAGPTSVAMTRLFGKPFTVSEFNYVAPNPTRYEGGLIMGAAAALQDWDGVWRFAWAHSRETALDRRPIGYFDVASDPEQLATERAALLLFRRGDLAAAPHALSRVLAHDALMKRFDAPLSPGFGELTLVTRIGSRVEDPARPLPPPLASELRLARSDGVEALAGLLRTGRLPAGNKTNLTLETRQSETNQVFVDGGAGTLRIITPRTLGGVAPEAETLRFGTMTVALEGADAAVWASSLDSRPVAQSGRLLLCHVTEIQNTGARFLSSERRELEKWGDLPCLARRGTALVTLTRTRPAAKVQAWRLDAAGNRIAPLEVRQQGADLLLELSTQGPDGKATLYYELSIVDPAPKPAAGKPR